jgi:hypothetical protein
MSIMPRNRKIGTIILVVMVGLLLGAYLNQLVSMLLPAGNVVRTIFCSAITFGLGDFLSNKPLLLDLAAIKLQVGFQFQFSLLSAVGIAVSLYLFRWYE